MFLYNNGVIKTTDFYFMHDGRRQGIITLVQRQQQCHEFWMGTQSGVLFHYHSIMATWVQPTQCSGERQGWSGDGGICKWTEAGTFVIINCLIKVVFWPMPPLLQCRRNVTLYTRTSVSCICSLLLIDWKQLSQCVDFANIWHTCLVHQVPCFIQALVNLKC